MTAPALPRCVSPHVILVGERLAHSTQARCERGDAARGSDRPQRLAWIPAAGGGAWRAWRPAHFPTLLPGGRARHRPRRPVPKWPALWGGEEPPLRRSASKRTGILAAAARRQLDGPVVAGGVDLDDLPDPQAAREALLPGRRLSGHLFRVASDRR